MIQEFKTYLLHIKGYSPNTVEAYVSDIKDFQSFIRERMSHPRWGAVTRDDVDAYCVVMSSNGKSGRTINRRLASIGALYNFFKRNGYVVDNPAHFECRHKPHRALPNVIKPDDLLEAIRHADDEVGLILRILYATGIRTQELLDMRIEDIDFEALSIRVHGKGAKDRLVYMDEATRDKVLVYVSGGTRGKLFPMLSPREVRRMTYEAIAPFSSAPQLSPHAIRHTFATECARKGMNTSALAELLGHERLETTQKYVNMAQSAVKQLYLQFTPTN